MIDLVKMGLDMQRASVGDNPFNVYCWHCGSLDNLSRYGNRWICSGCKASENQELREDAREEEE